MLLTTCVSICQEQLEVDGAIIIQQAQQTFDPATGTIRFNPVTNDFEGYNGFYWTSLTGTQYEVGSVSDADGNSYQTVKIGTQEWMAENLRTTRYHNASQTPITFIDNSLAGNTDWANANYGAYAVFDTTGTGYPAFSVEKFGYLYNWHALTDNRGLCPSGWHAPSDAEWNVLLDYLDPGTIDPDVYGTQSSVAGNPLKSTGTVPEMTGYWENFNEGATNNSGFSGLPGGSRSSVWSNLGRRGSYWSNTEQVDDTSRSFYRRLSRFDGDVDRDSAIKWIGFSVRCVKD